LLHSVLASVRLPPGKARLRRQILSVDPSARSWDSVDEELQRRLQDFVCRYLGARV
jgi:hypothetical protein